MKIESDEQLHYQYIRVNLHDPRAAARCSHWIARRVMKYKGTSIKKISVNGTVVEIELSGEATPDFIDAITNILVGFKFGFDEGLEAGGGQE